jgi:hydrogenase nickel insertion protein HypA
MRELNVVQAVFKQVMLRLHGENPISIKSLKLARGELFELDEHSIREHWRELSKGTLAEQAQLHFRLIPAEVQCMACFQRYHPEGGKIHCPHCGSFGAKIISGEEFTLESIE